jgi:hypothetical protein
MNSGKRPLSAISQTMSHQDPTEPHKY